MKRILTICLLVFLGIKQANAHDGIHPSGHNGKGSSNLNMPSQTVPDPPTNVAAVAGNTQVTLSFNAPANDGGSPIINYTATSSPGGLTGTSTGTSVVVIGLVNGVSYTFTVVANNSIGSSVASVPSKSVTPITVPTVPRNVIGVGGNGSATLAFSAPVSDGGSKITGYTAISSPGGKIGTSSGTNSITIPGLTNGISYTFTVYATNAAGNSSFSSPSNAIVPKTVASVPTNVIATPGNQEATLTFQAPQSNGGSNVTGYTAVSSPGGLTGSSNGSNPSITIIGLTNGVSYNFTVTATNAAGVSAPSLPSNSVTPYAGCITAPSTTNLSICSNALPYTWNGLTFTTAGSQTAHITNASGCDSAVTLNLSVVNGPGHAGTALNFDGENDYISLPSNSITSKISGGSITVETWVNMKSYVQWGSIIKNWGPSTGAFHFGLDANSGKISIYISQSNGTVISIISPSKLSLNAWHHVAFSAAGGILSLYEDGVLISSTSYDGTLKTSFQPTFIGVKPNTTGTGPAASEQGYWDGSMDELRIWNTGRTQSEIQAEMNKELVGNEAGLIGYYNFNATSGSVLADKTSNAKDGTLTNFALTGATSNWFNYGLVSILGASSVCNGSTIALSNSGGVIGGVWSSLNSSASVDANGIVTGRANSGAATIEYRYTANGCNLSASKVITVNAMPNAPSIAYAAGTTNPQTGIGGTFCNNKTFTLVGTPTGGTWSGTGGVTIGATTGVVNTTTNGAASVTYTVTNGVCSNSRTIAATIATCASRLIKNEMEIVKGSDFIMYPNPAHSFININVKTVVGSGSIIVTDLYGKQVKQQVLSIGNNTIDVSRLTKGMYFVSVITEQGKKTEKIVVE